jgi:hypothetical protein
MFAVDDASAEGIRRALHDSGELGAMTELRWRYPGVLDNA